MVDVEKRTQESLNKIVSIFGPGHSRVWFSSKMAGARPGVHVIKLKKVCVPSFMTEIPGNEKLTFIKWQEDSGVVYATHLRVDQNGYYIFYENPNKEVEFIDTLTIRDTRIGKYAKSIKSPIIKAQIQHMTGLSEINPNNILTIVTGSDIVNLEFINFYCISAELNEKWATELLNISYNILQVNNPTASFLFKIYTKIILSASSAHNKRIHVHEITKIFTSDKDERKRVEKALDGCRLPSGKTDTIKITQFTFDTFLQFYKKLLARHELKTVFKTWSNHNKRRLMSGEQFMNFINKEQRDPRLNEVLYPHLGISKVHELIDAYEPNVHNRKRNQLSLHGFMNYLLSEDNNIINMEKFDLIEDDMIHPLSHYFVNSSHNTYLIGHQLRGKSSVEMYRQSLLAGCRCIELDLWNGELGEPVIFHGYSFVPKIPAREVIEAIAECAFKTSKYPVILSFENHCNKKQQAKIAKYCFEYFGDMLLNLPLDSHPLIPGVSLPPPSALLNRILIKNKKKSRRHHRRSKPALKTSLLKKMSSFDKKEKCESAAETTDADDEVTDDIDDCRRRKSTRSSRECDNDSKLGDESLASNTDTSDEEEDNDEVILPNESIESDIIKTDTGTAGMESGASVEISALVNYVQPVRFYSFKVANHTSKSYEMSSFHESQAQKLARESPKEFVNYNKFQLTRVYPKATRVDSTNFMPQQFWNVGCQLVALNYQTLDLPMQLNIGIFEQNHRAGYLLKPECMRRNDRDFDPFVTDTIDGIIAGSLEIKVISGQFLSDKRIGTYVEVDLYGLHADTVKKKFRTRTVPMNGINPVYDAESFEFEKIILPDLAYLRVAAYEESSKLIGHRVLPIVGLRPGYRHVSLRNESGMPLVLPTLFLRIGVKDFVPHKFSTLVDALYNPIRYQNEIKIREKQMEIYADETDSMPTKSYDTHSILHKSVSALRLQK